MRRQGVPAEALEVALEAVRHAYSDPFTAVRLAEVAEQAGPGDPEIAAVCGRARGMAAAARGDLASSVRLLRRAARTADRAGLDVRAAQARGSLAYALVLTGRGSAALAELDRADTALGAGVDAARLRMQRGLVLSELRRVDEARTVLLGATRLLAAAGGDDLLEGDIRNNLAIVETARLDWTRAEEQLDRAEALFERTGLGGRAAMVWHNRATARSLRGDVPGSLAAFDEAERRYRDAGMSPGLLPVERAEVLLSAGLVVEARDSAAQAVAAFTRQGNRVDLVQARLQLAEALLLDHDPERALAEATSARRAAARQVRPGWAALAAFAELRAREASGATPRALLAPGRRVAEDLRAAGWAPQALDAMLLVARAALRSGRDAEAGSALDDVRRARRAGPAGVRVRAWHAQALHRRAAGDRRGTRDAVAAGLRVVDDFRASLGATDLRAHVAVLAGELTDLAVELALESGRPSAVLSAAESSRAAALWVRPTRPDDDAELTADLAELRRLESDRRSGDVAPQVGLGRQAVLERAVRDRARHAAGAMGARRRLDLAALRAALGERVLVELVAREGELWAVVAGQGATRLVPLGSEAAVVSEADALLAGLRWLLHSRSGTTEQAARTLVQRSAARLDTLVVGPCLGTVGAHGGGSPAAAQPLVLVPGARLAALPWAALPSLSGRPFTVAPSATAWLRAAAGQDGAAASGARSSAGVLLAHGPDLPGAAGEVRELASAYPGSRVLTDAGATVAAVLAGMDGSSVVHLAAHGRLRADNPMFSSLAFSDGHLTLHDLERLAVAPRLVTLASCDAGLGAIHPHDEVVGLATGLLAMGASTVVAPVLAVPDDATSRLMAALHRRLRSGAAPAAALAGARRDVLASSREPADAVTSAGFTSFGAG